MSDLKNTENIDGDCKCIDEIKSKIHERYPTYNNKKVVKVQIDGTYRVPDFKIVTTTDFNLVIENQKKEIPIKMSHAFCPWCGIKQKTDDSN